MWLAVRVERHNSESKYVAIEAPENALFGDLVEKLKGGITDEDIEEVCIIMYLVHVYFFQIFLTVYDYGD